jgi:hypothetical protein
MTRRHVAHKNSASKVAQIHCSGLVRCLDGLLKQQLVLGVCDERISGVEGFRLVQIICRYTQLSGFHFKRTILQEKLRIPAKFRQNGVVNFSRLVDVLSESPEHCVVMNE